LRGLIEETFFAWHGKAFNVTCSIGIATAPDDRIADWNDLLDKADQALYRGKRTGKNVVLAFNSGERQSSTADHAPAPRTRLVGDFRGLIE
jgi:PleD family two-component response regulator